MRIETDLQRGQARRYWKFAAIGAAILLMSQPGRAQSGSAGKPQASSGHKPNASSQRVSLAPRFVPGQTFRYNLEYESSTETSRSGLASDPQGPSSFVVDWSATVRVEILRPEPGSAAAVRLRTTYEKSSANVRSDSFDPTAAETREQYEKLQDKVIEFSLDAAGKVQSVRGLEGILDEAQAAKSAQQWIAQLSASASAPARGVAIGETWSSDQEADSLPIAGLVWQTDSQYLRNQPCRQPNSNLPVPSAQAQETPDNDSAEMCAVVLANLSLVRPKRVHDQTPPEFRKNGLQSTGICTGSAQSLVYVSLKTGFVVSVTQSGNEQMDVTVTNSHNTFMRYKATISTRSQVALMPDDSRRE